MSKGTFVLMMKVMHMHNTHKKRQLLQCYSLASGHFSDMLTGSVKNLAH